MEGTKEVKGYGTNMDRNKLGNEQEEKKPRKIGIASRSLSLWQSEAGEKKGNEQNNKPAGQFSGLGRTILYTTKKWRKQQ